MTNSVPQWYASLLQLKPLIDSGNWDAVQKSSKDLIKSLYVEAPTAKDHIEAIILLTLNTPITETTKEKIKQEYNKAVTSADKELDATDYQRILNEEEVADRLSVVNNHISTSWRIIWNYWRGEGAGDYQDFLQIGKDLETKPMTQMGRLRLKARYQNVADRISPSFMTMIVQLWPLAVIWLIKKLGPLLIKMLFQKQLEKRKTKKQAEVLKSKLTKGFDVGSLRKVTNQRSKRRSRRK